LEENRWVIRSIDDWGDYRWDFSGGGSIGFEVGVSEIKPAGDGVLRVDWRNGRGRGTVWLAEDRLSPTDPPKPGAQPGTSRSPSASGRPVVMPPDPAAEFPGVQGRSASDLGDSGQPDIRYELRWHTLGPNRDRPHKGPLPPPSILRVVRLPL
jgi:hypothetical protein